MSANKRNGLPFIIKYLVGCAVVFMTFAVGSSYATDTSPSAENDTIVIGRVSTNPKKHYNHLKPVADYLTKNLRDLGISKTEIIFAKDNKQMIRYIKQGKVDLITETAFSAVVFNQKAGADIVLRRWKKGVAEYSSIIFSRNDSGIHSFDDLLGKTIAFQDRGSTSSFFIPASILIREGYELYELDSPREKPPADAIGFVFAEKEINISAWVHRNIVAAGAMSDLNWNNERDMPKEFRQQTEVLYQSIPFPRGVELIRNDLNPSLKNRIVEVLASAHESEEGRKMLKAYQKTKQYDALSIQDDSLIMASELQRIVEDHL